MPAPLVPPEQIPELATVVDTPARFEVLRLLRQLGGVLVNGGHVDAETAATLRAWDGLLVDAAYAQLTDAEPHSWVLNANGDRVYEHLRDRGGPA